MSDKKLSDAETTQLATVVKYLGGGEAALNDLQGRVDQLGLDDRITVGEVKFADNGQPTCGITFDCSSYEPPVEGRPDPKAIEDLTKLLSGINLDACLDWKHIALKTLTHS